MESITKNDIRYLIALTASEESMLVEIIWEFNKWDCDKAIVLKELFRLVSDNHVSIFRQNGEKVTDLSREQSLTLVREWSSLGLKDHFLCFTDSGERLWESEDWGITTKRARHLMFGNTRENRNA